MKKSQGAVRFARPTGRSEAGRDVKTKRMMDAAQQRPTRCKLRPANISLTDSQAGAPGRKRKEGRDLWSLSDGAELMSSREWWTLDDAAWPAETGV